MTITIKPQVPHIYVCINLNVLIYHHCHVVPLAWISLILSCHLTLLSIIFSRFSRLHLVSIQSCCRYVLARHPTPACPCGGVHWRTLLMSSCLLLQQCPTCLVPLIWMVVEMGSKCPYSCCFVGCCFQDLFTWCGVNELHRSIVRIK